MAEHFVGNRPDAVLFQMSASARRERKTRSEIRGSDKNSPKSIQTTREGMYNGGRGRVFKRNKESTWADIQLIAYRQQKINDLLLCTDVRLYTHMISRTV